MDAIKHFFILQATKKRSIFDVPQQKMTAFSDIKNLLLLTSVPIEQLQKSISWIAQSYENIQEIQVLNFQKEKTAFKHHHHQVRIKSFSPHDFNLFGQPKKDLSELISQSKVNLLLNSVSVKNMYLDWISVRVKADLKVITTATKGDNIYAFTVFSKNQFTIEESLRQTQKYMDALSGRNKTD